MNFEIILTYPPSDDGNGFDWYNGGGSDLLAQLLLVELFAVWEHVSTTIYQECI